MTNNDTGRPAPQTPAQRRKKRRDKLKSLGLTEHRVIVPDTDEAKAAINRAAAELVKIGPTPTTAEAEGSSNGAG